MQVEPEENGKTGYKNGFSSAALRIRWPRPWRLHVPEVSLRKPYSLGNNVNGIFLISTHAILSIPRLPSVESHQKNVDPLRHVRQSIHATDFWFVIGLKFHPIDNSHLANATGKRYSYSKEQANATLIHLLSIQTKRHPTKESKFGYDDRCRRAMLQVFDKISPYFTTSVR